MDTKVIDWEARYNDLREKHLLLLDEVGALKKFHEGAFTETYDRMNHKIQRQRKMLNTYQRRLRGQRLHLRVINELGRNLTSEEWADAKAAYPEDLENYAFEF